jgi:NAD(P)-dependent dehydrogenase (short-subunit alcohol dehydrogenase family)
MTPEFPVGLVTGAGSGIGKATVEVLGRQGYRLVCADIDRSAAEATASQFQDAIAVEMDVRDREACERMVRTSVDRFGRVDALVHCVGIADRTATLDMTDETFDRVIAVNVKGTFLTCQAIVRQLVVQRTGGSIVLVASIGGLIGVGSQIAYSASKGAMLQIGRELAKDFAPAGIRVNVLAPGLIETPMSRAVVESDELRAGWMSRTPLGRVGLPGDVAAIAAFLLSKSAGYITGAVIPVDGGWLSN